MFRERSIVCKSWKAKTVASVIAVVAAVAIPQVFHLLGAASGHGTALGEIFLPMHLAVLVVGLLAGPLAGLATGAISPIISSLLTGMPKHIMLPFMVVELAGYGLAAGLMSGTKLPSIVKLLVAQIAGRALRAVAVLIAVFGFGNAIPGVATIWTTITVGLPGLALQWVLIPLFTFWIERVAGERK